MCKADWRIVLLNGLVSGLPAWWGRSPLGVPFGRAKGTKTRLGRSPLSTPLGYEAKTASSARSARHPCCGSCLCHHTRPPRAAGPITGWFPRPGLPWRSGVPAAGSFCRTILLRCGRGRGLPGPKPLAMPGQHQKVPPLTCFLLLLPFLCPSPTSSNLGNAAMFWVTSSQRLPCVRGAGSP